VQMTVATYKVVKSIYTEDFERKLNQLAFEGYRVLSIVVIDATLISVLERLEAVNGSRSTQ